MLAIALGLKAVHAGYRVYYTTAADLVARTSRAALEGRWQTTMRFWNGPQLLVIDELGYLPMPGEAARHLFQVISRRYEHGSIILTTNRGIAAWGEIFEDTTVAAAILDRLLHHATVLQIDGDSYRMRVRGLTTPRPSQGCCPGRSVSPLKVGPPSVRPSPGATGGFASTVRGSGRRPRRPAAPPRCLRTRDSRRTTGGWRSAPAWPSPPTGCVAIRPTA